MPDIKIVPSVLPADFSKLGAEVEELADAGVDGIQFDVMDGHFVPNLTFGAATIKSVRDNTKLPFEAHLMIENPDQYLSEYVDAGCETIIVHAEACTHLHRTLSKIKELGASASVALNPHTPLDHIANVADLVGMLVVMTVNPGFGGQKYIELEDKLKEARKLASSVANPFDIEVDGGINLETINHAAASGANVFISGSTLFNHPEGKADCVAQLRANAEASFAG